MFAFERVSENAIQIDLYAMQIVKRYWLNLEIKLPKLFKLILLAALAVYC